jgi:hypothetical protein
MENEYILCSAISYHDEIFTGYRCGDAIKVFLRIYFKEALSETIQGFITSKGRFVDRTEAYYIAEKNNQIKFEVIDFKGKTPLLMSINLYED